MKSKISNSPKVTKKSSNSLDPTNQKWLSEVSFHALPDTQTL